MKMMTSFDASGLIGRLSLSRRFFWCCLLLFAGWSRNAAAYDVQPLQSVYLYSSPITTEFFKQNGTSYEALKQRWREYFRPYGKKYREVSRANLIDGLKPGVLILASAVLLDEQERQAVQAFTAAGGSVLATWATGARDGRGRWSGYGFIEELLQMKVVAKGKSEITERFLNTFGDSPLTWTVPGGERVFLGEIAETPLRVASPNLAARYFDWQRLPAAKESNGAIAFLERDASRRVYLGFAESSWEYDERAEIPKIVDAVMSWLKHEPRIFKAAWPNGELSAQLLEMDTEAQYGNAVNFARDLDAANIRGTFYSLTSIARDHRDTVKKLSEKHEIGYHAEVHVGFKGKTPEEQQRRLNIMVSDMGDIVGSRRVSQVTGFRAPTESWDATTEKLLRKLGVRHHVADPSASEARMPFFSQSEPGLGNEDAMVVLPRTQMDDLNYQSMKLSFAEASELITRDFDYLHEAGALGVLSVHSQNYGADGLMAKLTPPYIKRLQEHRHDVWTASGEEIEAWWRARDRVVLQSLQALSTRFSFEVRAPGGVKGLSFFVTHPAMDVGLKKVTPTTPEMPQPEVKRVDAYRSIVIFKDELKVGSYVYNVGF